MTVHALRCRALSHTAIATLCFWLVGFAIKAFAWPLCYLLQQRGSGVSLAALDDSLTGSVGRARSSTS